MSRYASAHHLVHECEDGEDRFVSDVAAAVAVGGYDVIFCGYDIGLLTLSRRRAEIAPAVWPYPPDPVVQRAFDKLELTRAAQAAGLSVPHTEPATANALRDWTGPVIVKARAHAPTRFETGLFSSTAQAHELIEQIGTGGGEPLLQEPIDGQMGAVIVLVGRDSVPIVEIHQQALRTWPTGAGDTVRGRVVAPDPALSQRVHALVRELGWFGLAQIEFVRDADGVAQITDFNGRFYGSMALATGAGANLPALWTKLALGEHHATTPAHRLGTRFQWLSGDLSAARASGISATLRALAFAPFAVHSMWSSRDPAPAVRYLVPRTLGRMRALIPTTGRNRA